MGTSHPAYHQLEFIRGWFAMTVLAYRAKKSASVTIDLPVGRCVALNSSGEFVTGCQGREMPMWVTSASDAADVRSSDAGESWVTGQPQGFITAVVAKGAYELGTTEYDTAQTYAYNEYLRAPRANTTLATGGVLTNQSIVYITNTPLNWTAVVGQVSKPPAARTSDRRALLRFWPKDCLPGASGL